MKAIRSSFTLVALFILASTSSVLGQDAAKKNSVPADAAQAEATKLIKEVYGDEYKSAKTVAQKTGLAEKLLQKASESKADPAAHYVLLKLARDIAVQAGEADLALRAVEDTASAYQVDVFAMKLETIIKAAKSATLSKQYPVIVEQAKALLDESIGKDDFEAATNLGEVALATARKGGNAELIKQVVKRKKDAEEIRKAYEETKDAFAALERKPAAPEANLAVGKYLCLMKGQWEKGLPKLALGSDPQFKVLAVKELEGTADASAQVALGDGWWSLAEKEEGLAKKQIQGRAGYWYKRALPGMKSGLVKDKVEKRLKQVLPDGDTSNSNAVCVPRLIRIDELNTKGFDNAYPWLSADGLAIYWTREGSGKLSATWTAHRETAESPFANARQVLPGRHPTLTGDQLEIIFVADNHLYSARRSVVSRPFSKARTISEFEAESTPKSPVLSPDGLSLLMWRGGQERGEIVLWTRAGRSTSWSRHRVIVTEFSGNTSWPFITSNGLHLFICTGGARVQEFLIGSRNSLDAPFRDFKPVQVGNVLLRGRSPRYCEATNELFFCAPRSSETHDFDLWVVKNFTLP